MIIEMSDNMQTSQHTVEQLQNLFTEMGWWSIQRAAFVAVERGKRRPLQLTDEREEADEQFRYYHAQFRYADTNKPLVPPFRIDLRWEAS